MKNYAPLAIVICFASVIYGMILMPDGYEDASRTFYGYENQPRQEVERNLSLILPNVQFKVYKDPEQQYESEEFYFGRIKIVVNDDDIVIFPPHFFGIQPNLTFANNLIGKSVKIAVDTIRKNLPDTKIVVQSKGCTMIWQSSNKKEDYIQVEVSNGMKVVKLPKFVRVPK